MDTIFDLPAHPLFVHVPIVLVPLVAAAAVALALRPTWRRTYGWHLLAATAVVFVSIILATRSGEGLDRLLQGAQPIREHRQLGETTRLLVFGLLVVVAAMVVGGRWLDRRRDALPSWAAPVRLGLSGVIVILSVLSTIWIIRTGHTGAESHWAGLVK